MEAGFIALLILTTIISIVAGIYIEKVRAKRRNDKNVQGVLNIICDNPESAPQLFLQLIVPVEDVVRQKQTTFDVNVIQ